jgi:hypothetical protein
MEIQIQTDVKAAQTLTTITTNNNNNDSYSLSPPEDEQTSNDGSCGPCLAPLSEEANTSVEVICSGVGNPAEEKNIILDTSIPPNWDYIKIDLFDNSTNEDLAKGKTKLKIALNIKKTGQTKWNSFNAGLNTPIRNMKRGLDGVTWDGPHYMGVRESHAELKTIYSDVRASKFYEKGYKGKGTSIEELSVIVAQHPQEGCYVVNLHFADQQWVWLMRGGKGFLSQTQRKKGMIATVGIRKGNKIKNKNARDLL